MSATVFLITPPFTQLNTPYPATAYLKGFLNTKHISAFQADLGIEVTLQLFSKTGLKKLFAAISQTSQTSENAQRIITLQDDYIASIDDVILKMNNAAIKFPAIAKPDRGERGWCVDILKNTSDLEKYLLKYPIDFLLQEYIDYPMELSIFFYRHPDAANGMITSVTSKEYLKITGDGISNLYKLIEADDRAFLQLEKLKHSDTIDFNKILKHGEIEILVPFGNHVRGALFLDYCDVIDEKLNTVFNNISKQIEGFYFGRFDIKCKSIKDLKEGKHFSILELNGSGAEPAHIYQPGFSFFKAQKIIIQHYKMMYEAAKANHKKGTAYMSLQSFRQVCKAQKEHKLKVVAAI